MHKDVVAHPLEPFTTDEEAALFARLDRLSVSELESYIGSARTSLGNRALDPTWRPRIELALKHAEVVHLREEAAAAVLAAMPPVAVVAPVKPKRASKAKAAKADAAVVGAAAADTDDAKDEETEADEAE